jgi:hypothetical protein
MDRVVQAVNEPFLIVVVVVVVVDLEHDNDSGSKGISR